MSAVDREDVNGRAGRHEWGYVGPDEAAWGLLEEAVEPFFADMKRRLDLGHEAEALEICQGTVPGLSRVRHDSTTDTAVGSAPDFPLETAGVALDGLLQG